MSLFYEIEVKQLQWIVLQKLLAQQLNINWKQEGHDGPRLLT
jgi:hypothetical protein